MDSESAYNNALAFAKSHYENFPVVSFLIRKDLRKHVAIIYWFARTADDFADEGNLTEEERLKKLSDFEIEFDNLSRGNFNSEFENALYLTITEKSLNPLNFKNLLSAFKQDVTKKRYNDYTELLDYCSRSANPVGRLILELHDIIGFTTECINSIHRITFCGREKIESIVKTASAFFGYFFCFMHLFQRIQKKFYKINFT